MSTLTRVAATGDVATGARTLHSVILTPAAAAATLEVRVAGGTGNPLLSLSAPANGASAIWHAASPRGQAPGVPFGAGIHATLTGASASATFEYD